MTKFEPGKRYRGRFICDADSFVYLTVNSRTEKTIRTDSGKSLKIHTSPYDDGEFVFPLGRYSMAPTIRAAAQVEGARHDN